MAAPSRTGENAFDLVLVGGGLQNGLIALRVLHGAAALRVALVEAEPTLGGNHTWCVHGADVPDAARGWFDPLIVKRWSSYDVRFPDLKRTLNSAYSVVTSEHFARVVGAAFEGRAGCRIYLGRRARRIAADHVELDDGTLLYAALVVDARGPDPAAWRARTGYQKFVGLELRTERAHGVERPLMMDACVPQLDGYRFFYVLPFDQQRLLVEETRFSRSPTLDVRAARAAVEQYAQRFGRVIECVREEQGVLPMPWSDALPEPVYGSPLAAGYRGGYFHPATGYSLPAALRLAQLVGVCVTETPSGADDPAQSDHRPGLGGARAGRAEWRSFQRRHRAQARYARQLNRLLFGAFADADMWNVFARFYRLPEPLIERFYALSMTLSDRARILIGRPPRGFSVARVLSPEARP
jgi:lycopene beta-cyclase